MLINVWYTIKSCFPSHFLAFSAGLALDVAVVCIQEPFLGNRSISHSGFNLYWPSGTDNRKDMRVLTAVRKDILNEVIIDN